MSDSKYFNEYGVCLDEDTKELSNQIENLVRQHIKKIYANQGTIVDATMMVQFIQDGVHCTMIEQKIKESIRLKRLAKQW